MADKIEISITADDQASGVLDKVTGGIGGFIGKMAGGLATFDLAAGGIGKIAGAISGFISDASNSQAVAAQTAAVIASTGGAAGMTADQIGDLATGLSQVAPIDDEVIQSAENMLLTFTNIGSNVFPQATKTVLDMSVALGQDTKSSAIQLGKALNDPITGITALQRVGVTFTQTQKDQIAAMVQAGDVAGAQGVILQELSKEFGGSAVAAGQTFGGQLAIAKTQLGNVKEAIGTALLPMLVSLMQHVTPLIVAFGQWLPGALTVVTGWITRLGAMLQGPLESAFRIVRDGVLTFAQALSGNWTDSSKIEGIHRVIGNLGLIIRNQVIPAVEKFAGFFQEKLLPVMESAGQMIERVVAAFSNGGIGAALETLVSEMQRHLGVVAQLFLDLGQKLVDWVEPMIPPLLEKLGNLLTQVGDWIVNTGVPALAQQLGQWADAFGAWAEVAVPPMLQKLGDLLGQLGNWFADTGLPLILQKLGEWGQALIDWIEPRIGPVLEALGKLLLAIGTWFATVALPAIIEKLAEWGAQFVAWVEPQIPPLLAKLGDLLSQLGDWLVSTALPEIISDLAQWGQEFVAWVAPQIPPLLGELGSLLASLGDWLLTTALPEIITKLAQWGAEFVKWVAPQIPPLLAELGNLLGQLLIWLVTTALPQIVTDLAQWGAAFIGWVATDVLPKLPGALADILTTLAGWVSGAIDGIVSECAQIGQAIIDGIKSGVVGAVQSLKDAVTGAVGDAIQAGKDFLHIKSPSQVAHDEIGVPISQGIAQGIIEGNASIASAVQTVVNTVPTAASNLTPHQAGVIVGRRFASGVTDGTVQGISSGTSGNASFASATGDAILSPASRWMLEHAGVTAGYVIGGGVYEGVSASFSGNGGVAGAGGGGSSSGGSGNTGVASAGGIGGVVASYVYSGKPIMQAAGYAGGQTIGDGFLQGAGSVLASAGGSGASGGGISGVVSNATNAAAPSIATAGGQSGTTWGNAFVAAANQAVGTGISGVGGNNTGVANAGGAPLVPPAVLPPPTDAWSWQAMPTTTASGRAGISNGQMVTVIKLHPDSVKELGMEFAKSYRRQQTQTI